MKILLEKSKYHKFALYFDYTPDRVDFCKDLKDSFGWQKFSFDVHGELKRWVFSEPIFIKLLSEKFPEIKIQGEASEEEIAEKRRVEDMKNKNKKIDLIRTKETTDFKVKGLKGEMYDYQKVGVEFLEASGGRAIIADSPGVGKSLQALGYIKHKGFKRSLIVCPASVKFAWESEVKKWTNMSSVIIDSKTDLSSIDSSVNIWIINYDILKKHYPQLSKIKFNNITGDEAQYCFPGETLIKTNIGSVPIKKIVEKKLEVSVASCNFLSNEIEYKKIKGYQQNKKIMPLLKIKHKYGELTCTANHRIWTEKGYIEAGLLTKKSNLYLRLLREDIQDSNKRKKHCKVLFPFLCRFLFKLITSNKKSNKEKKSKKNKNKMCLVRGGNNRIGIKVKKRAIEAFLRKILFCKMESKTTMGDSKCKKSNKKSARSQDGEKMSEKFRTHEATKQGSRIQKKNKNWLRELDKSESRFFSSFRRKWSLNRTSGYLSEVDGITDRTCYFNDRSKGQIQTSSKWIQSGLGCYRKEDSNRDRWEFASDKKNKDIRQEENKNFISSRVVSVKILEQGGIGESAKSSEENTIVYNIEVADNNNYFADGVLVSNCKSPKALRTKAFRALSVEIPSAVLLSGTPLLSRPSELYSLLNIIDPARWTNWYEYATKYCNLHQTRWGMDSSGVSNAEELHSLIKRYFIRRRKEDVLTELPPKIFVDIPVQLDTKTKKEYDSAATDLANYLRDYAGKKDGEIERTMAAEKLTQLNVLRRLSAMGKIGTATELINSIIDSGEKVLVFSSFREPLRELQSKLKVKSVMITGETSTGERGEIVNAFQNDDNVKVFLGGIKSAGVGITLTKASSVIFLDYSYNPADHSQAYARADRIGNEAKSINIYYLHAKGTIDEDLKEMIETKQETFNQIIDGKFEKRKSNDIMKITTDRILREY